ncbi:MAG: hypothetical protein ACOH2H_09110 [Cypionkella sp.]
MRVLSCLCLLTIFAACSSKTTDLRLYPVEGPIAMNDPSQAITISLNHKTETSGDISFRMPPPSKNRCKGTWTSVAPKVVSHERGLSLTLRDTGGKYTNSTKDVGGINSGEIYAICTDGTRVQGRFITGSGTESGTGTVTDSLGNTYKLLF